MSVSIGPLSLSIGHLLLVIAFGLIFLYFRSRGGYKPVELRAEPHDRVEEG